MHLFTTFHTRFTRTPQVWFYVLTTKPSCSPHLTSRVLHSHVNTMTGNAKWDNYSNSYNKYWAPKELRFLKYKLTNSYLDRGSIPTTEAIPKNLERIDVMAKHAESMKNVFEKKSKKTGENETITGKLEEVVKTWRRDRSVHRSNLRIHKKYMYMLITLPFTEMLRKSQVFSYNIFFDWRPILHELFNFLFQKCEKN